MERNVSNCVRRAVACLELCERPLIQCNVMGSGQLKPEEEGVTKRYNSAKLIEVSVGSSDAFSASRVADPER